MKIKKLKSLKDFESLKKGDQILVKWSDFFVKHHDKSKKIMMYTVYMNKGQSDEIICQQKGNHYFNYKMHLGLDTPSVNTSQAEEVYLVKE